MRPARFAAFLAFALSCAALSAPRISAEVPLDPAPGREALSAYTYGPTTHFNGQQFVMTWTDSRSGNSMAFAALVDVDGGVAQHGTRILADGDDFPNSGPTAGCRRGPDMLFAAAKLWSGSSYLLRTTPALSRLSLTSLPINSNLVPAFSCAGPAPVWVANSPLYVPTADAEMRVFALRGDAGLEALDGGAPLVVRLGFGNASARVATTLAWDGARHLLAWADGRTVGTSPDGGVLAISDVWGAFIDTALGVSPQFLLAGGAGDQAQPRLAFDGIDYVLMWSDAPSPGEQRDVWARRVSPTGALGAPFTVANTSADEGDPVLTFDGASLVAAWRVVRGVNDSELMTATLAGASASAPESVYRSFVDALDLATSGAGRSLLTFRDFHRGIRTVGVVLRGASRMDDAGVVDPATTEWAQLRPRVTRGPAGHAVLWQQGGTTVGALVTPSGFDGGHQLVGPLNSGLTGLAFDGTQFLALWDDLTVRRLGADLAPVDPAPFKVGPYAYDTQSNPAWDGRAYVLARADHGTAPEQIVAYHVFPDGGAEAPLPIATAAQFTADLSVAANTEGTSLVAWSGEDSVRAACLRGGAVTAGAPVPLDLGNTPSHNPRARVASDGHGFLVVWADRKSPSPLLYDLWGVLIGPDCVVVPAEAFNLGGIHNVDQFAPAVAFDGKQYVVAWVTSPEPKGDIVLRRVSLDGGLGAPLLVASDPTTDEGQPALSAEGPGHWLVAYTRFERDEARSARRAVFRWIVDDSLGAPCTSATDCASGACADQVCCDSVCTSDGGARRVCREALGAPSDGVCSDELMTDAGPLGSNTDGGALGSGSDGGLGRQLSVGCDCATAGDAWGACLLAGAVAAALSRRRRAA